MNLLDRDNARVLVPKESSQCATTGRVSIHKELEKGKFLEFTGATY